MLAYLQQSPVTKQKAEERVVARLFKVLQQVWPFVGQYLEKLLVETIAPSIRASSTHLQTLSFTKVDMGDKVL